MQLDQRRAGLSGILGSLRRRRQEEEPLIRRGRGDGVNVSLVPHAGVRHAFGVASARPGKGVEETAMQTLEALTHAMERTGAAIEPVDNIEALISEANLSRHGLPGFGAALHSLAVARVYIKRAEDYASIRAVCENRLGQVPVTYTLADVCRPQLLVEIEGIAFSRWACAQ